MTLEVANFLSVAWQAAVTAGSLIREQWQQPKSIDYKGAIDLVTSVDRESERRSRELVCTDVLAKDKSVRLFLPRPASPDT